MLDKFPLPLSQHFTISLEISSFSSQSKERGKASPQQGLFAGILHPVASRLLPSIISSFPIFSVSHLLLAASPTCRPTRASSSIYRHPHVSPRLSAQLCLRPSPGRLLRTGLSLPETRTSSAQPAARPCPASEAAPPETAPDRQLVAFSQSLSFSYQTRHSFPFCLCDVSGC